MSGVPIRRHQLQAFLLALGNGYSVTRASAACGISRSRLYALRDRHSVFERAWDAALEQGTDVLEDEALRRATEGKSDGLLIFLLKSRRPEKYKERTASEHTGRDGGPLLIEHAVVDRPPNETREQWLERRNRELAHG